MSARSRFLAAAACLPILALAGKGTVQPLPEGPVKYFTDHCARCHGPVDSPMNTAFEKAMPPEKLRKAIKDMAEGPGGAPVDGVRLDAQVALTQAMNGRRAYLAWTGRTDDRLTGEVCPSAPVTASVAGKSLPAKVSGRSWSVSLPPGVGPASVVLRTARGPQKTELDLSKAAFSSAPQRRS